MKNYYLLLFCIVLCFSSCTKEPVDTECEDYFEANEEIITGVWSWFPYSTGDHEIPFVSDSGFEFDVTVSRFERVEENYIGPIIKCPEVSISPRLVVKANDRLLFNVWAQDVALVDNQARAVFGTSAIFGTEPIINPSKKSEIIDMDTAGDTVTIRGIEYENVISFTYVSGLDTIYAIHLQKDKGILAYQEYGSLSVLR